jgi:hypothetical protein
MKERSVAFQDKDTFFPSLHIVLASSSWNIEFSIRVAHRNLMKNLLPLFSILDTMQQLLSLSLREPNGERCKRQGCSDSPVNPNSCFHNR